MRATLFLRFIGAFVALILAQSGAAFGHATVLSTEPADGAVLKEAPAAVVIRFNEPVVLISAQVVDASGDAVAQPEPPTEQDMQVRIALPSGLGEGAYVASYRVVSLDSHPIGGSIVFTVGEGVGSVAWPARSAEGGMVGTHWRIAFVALVAIVYAGIFGSAGCVLFLLAVRPPETVRASCGRIALAFAFATIGSATLMIGVEGGYLLDAAPVAIFFTDTWRTGFTSTLGRSAVVAIVGEMLIAAASLRTGAIVARVALAAGATLALASFGLTGHVVTAGPRLITVPLLLLHTTTVAFWVGSLLPLAVAVTLLKAEAAAIVQRFSRIAVWSVAALVAAGIGIAALQVGTIAALFESDYGQTLLLKLALVAALLLLAALNKLRLTPRLEAATHGAANALRISIAIECVLAFAIIAASAVLGTSPPPRVESDGAAPATKGEAHQHQNNAAGRMLTVHAADRMAMLTFQSASSGANALVVDLTDLDSVPIDVKEVSVVAENPAAGVEPIRRAASSQGNGRWRVDALMLVPAGRWSIRVDALVSDFEKTTFEATVDLH
jgi:copper transport protein